MSKVCLADINEIEGRQTEQELKQKYGDDALKFVKCDVTAETDVKSIHVLLSIVYFQSLIC